MVILAFFCAVLAAAFNAASSVLQRLSAGSPKAGELFSKNFIKAVAVKRMFLAGVGLQLVGFLMQAVALGNGPLVIVQPLLTVDLIFLLIFLYIARGIKTGPREWAAILLIIVGLGGLYVVAHPKGGHLVYHLAPWIVVISLIGAATLALAITVRHLKSPKLRGLMGGLAASGAFSLDAAFTKLALNQFNQYGFGYVMSHWPVYALICSGISALILMENAYAAGPLVWSQPTLEIGEPIISVTIGILIFGDSLNHTTNDIFLEFLMMLLIIAGVILLSSSHNLQPHSKASI